MTDFADVFYAHLNDRPAHVSHKEEVHAWASEALQCSRQIAFRLAGDGTARDYGLASLLIFRIGEQLHNEVQAAFLREPDRFPNCRTEVEWDLGHVSGRADAVYDGEDGPVVVEIKSMSAWAFEQALKKDIFGKRTIKGLPKPEHVMQAALGATALGAKRVHVVYVNKATRPDEPGVLDWVLDVDTASVVLELGRLQMVVDAVNDGQLPEPFYDGEVITRPEKKKWPCGYCAWRSSCERAGPEAVALEEVTYRKAA